MKYRLVVDACGDERSYPKGWISPAMTTEQEVLNLAKWITAESYKPLWYKIVTEGE